MFETEACIQAQPAPSPRPRHRYQPYPFTGMSGMAATASATSAMHCNNTVNLRHCHHRSSSTIVPALRLEGSLQSRGEFDLQGGAYERKRWFISGYVGATKG